MRLAACAARRQTPTLRMTRQAGCLHLGAPAVLALPGYCYCMWRWRRAVPVLQATALHSPCRSTCTLPTPCPGTCPLWVATTRPAVATSLTYSTIALVLGCVYCEWTLLWGITPVQHCKCRAQLVPLAGKVAGN